MYDVDPFVYVRINTRHTDTIKFHHNFGRTDCFKYNVYTRFPVQFQSLPRHIRDKLTISLSSFYLTVNYILNNPAGWMILNLVFLYVFFFSHLDLVHLDGLEDEQYACSVVLFLHGVLLG